MLLTPVKHDAFRNAFNLTVTVTEGSADTMVLTQFGRKVGHFAGVLTSADARSGVRDSEEAGIQHA